MFDFSDLKGRRALVTGASSGIGHAVAKAFGEAGVHVAIHYNNSRDTAEALAAGIVGKGGKAVALQADIRDARAIDALVSEAALALGGLDILVNNAGAMGTRKPIALAEDEVFEEVFALNCRSVISTTRAALPHLRASGSGVVINTGSIAGRNGGGPGAGFYASAKAYVHNISRAMAKEFAADGIRVNTVAPGVIATPFHDSTPKEVLASLKAAIPLGRLGTPEECAGAYLFFASGRLSGYVTGQIIDVNGGQFMP